MNCSIDGLELFSCALSNEDETALSILDPVSITVDVKPPSSHSRRTSVSPSQTPTDKVYSQTLLVCMLYCRYYEASDIPFMYIISWNLSVNNHALKGMLLHDN